MSDAITVRVNGGLFRDWSYISVTKELESVAASFEFDVIQAEKDYWSVWEGDKVEIFRGINPLVCGYVDYVGPDLDSTDRTIQVVGRDNTCDLIDCTYPGKKTEFTGQQNIQEIARVLIEPFGLKLLSQMEDIPKLKNFKIDPGEKVWDALERASSKLGVLFQPSGDGKLVLTKPATESTGRRIAEGLDLLDCYANFDNSARYSHYTLKVQDKKNKPVQKTAQDKDILRFRPLDLTSDSTMEPEEAQLKANWEMSVRIARSLEVSATLQGWSSEYQPNQIVVIHSPKNRLLEEELIIKSMTLNFDGDGTTTSLILTRPDAYLPESVKKKSAGKEAMKSRLKNLGYIN